MCISFYMNICFEFSWIYIYTEELICWVTWLTLGFSSDAVVKNLPANAGDSRDVGLIPRVRKIAWRRKWQPAPLFLPGESHGQWSLATVLRVTKSQTCMTHIHTFPLNNSLWKIFEAYYVGGFLYRGLISTSLKYSRVLPILEHFRLNFWGPPRKCEFYLSNTFRTSL